MVINVSLRYSEFFLYSQLHRKSVSVPSCLTMNLIAFHRLITVESILDGSCKYVMDSRMSVSRRRSFEKYKLRTSLAFCYAAMENIFITPIT